MNVKTSCSQVIAAALVVLFVISAPIYVLAGDDSFEAAFRKTYAYNAYLKGDAIHAEAADGVAKLTGTVAEESHKTLAQAIAANLSGITRVDNQLVIGNEDPAVPTDVSIARRINLVLQFHRDVTDSRTYVTVHEGVVTLQGVASGDAQRDLIASFVAEVAGVKEVRNEMTVASALEPAVQSTGETLDDASITAQIVTTLMAHRSTRTVITRVTTRNGVVTLTGITQNDAQNTLIVKLVTNIRGVLSVKNQMTVENEPRGN